MRIGIIGDIHANVDALTAVLAALDRANVTRVICTGDVVGYGAAPKECIDLVRDRKIPCVKGNHDEYTTQIGEDWKIQPDARTVIYWNQEVLPGSYRDWLRGLPRTLQLEDISIVHASYVWWPRWPYVINERTAVCSLLFQPNRLSFNSHTHVPLFVAHQPEQTPRLEVLHSMFLPRDTRVLVGVGSVGQPRDGDPRACGVIYDSDQQYVRVLRVPYDVEAAQARIYHAGLPEELALRLSSGH